MFIWWGLSNTGRVIVNAVAGMVVSVAVAARGVVGVGVGIIVG